jgi:hypothetical protein
MNKNGNVFSTDLWLAVYQKHVRGLEKMKAKNVALFMATTHKMYDDCR